MSHDPARRLDRDPASTPCEVCSFTGRHSDAREPWAFCERLIWLCDEHRSQAEAAPTSEALHTLFREPGGQRSLLPRRSEDRRVFPPRPEGRRKGSGRRRADPLV